jgi:hypothetical protein
MPKEGVVLLRRRIEAVQPQEGGTRDGRNHRLGHVPGRNTPDVPPDSLKGDSVPWDGRWGVTEAALARAPVPGQALRRLHLTGLSACSTPSDRGPGRQISSKAPRSLGSHPAGSRIDPAIARSYRPTCPARSSPAPPVFRSRTPAPS